MPAVAVVAAIGTVSTGLAMGGILGGVMVAGGVMSGLGAVTGNKKLARFGSVLSLGAGLGSALGLGAAADGLANSVTGAVPGDALFAQGRSLTDVAKGALGSVKDTLGVGADAGATQGLQVGASPANYSLTAPTSSAPSWASSSSLSAGAPGALGAVPVAGAPPAGLIQGALGGAQQAPLLEMGGASGLGMDVAAGASGGAFVSDAASYLTPVDYSLGSAGGGLGLSGAGGFAQMPAAPVGKLDGFLGFIKANPEVVKAGSGLVSGAMQSYGAQQAAAQEQALIERARQRYNDSITQQRFAAPRRAN